MFLKNIINIVCDPFLPQTSCHDVTRSQEGEHLGLVDLIVAFIPCSPT